VRAVVLTGGVPGVFIRHADVGGIAKSARALLAGDIAVSDFANNPFLDLVDLIEQSEVPVIAAINGVCMGGGLEVALACTVRIAGRDVPSIGLPEVRLDIIPGAGGMTRLAQVIGTHRARLHVLRGTVFDAAQAEAEGIVDELAEDAVAAALDLAQTLAGRNHVPIAMILRSFRDRYSSREGGPAFGAVVMEVGVLDRLDKFLGENERLDQIN